MIFRVKAMDSMRGVLVYEVEAMDEADARRQLALEGRGVISIVAQRTLGFSQPGRVPLLAFSRELVALLDAGLSLVEAVETLAEKEGNASVRRGLEQIRSRLFEGHTLSAALEELPQSFPPLYVATVRASERTGDIREALVRFVAYQQQVDLLRKKLVSASIYPLVLCGAGALVSVFLLGYVVPRFSGIYEDLGDRLPYASMLLMKWGQALEQHGLAILVGIVLAFTAIVYLLSRLTVRRAVSNAVAQIPAVGRQLHRYQLARLYRTVGMLLRGGTPAPSAMRMSQGLLSPGLRTALADALQSVSEGQSLAKALEKNGLTTPVAVRMLGVGELSGNMGQMMEHIAAFYDEELSRTVDILTRLIEPLLMAVIGLFIGLIVVLMYFPIFELAGTLQ